MGKPAAVVEEQAAGLDASLARGEEKLIKKVPVPSKPNHDLTHTLRVKRSDKGHELAWTPTNESTLGYQVWRSNSPFSLIAKLPAEQTTYVDAAAPLSSKYKVTYFTGEALDSGFVPSQAEPAALPEWNAEVFAAAAPIVVEADGGNWSTWVLLFETLALVVGLSVAIARPDTTARVLRRARSGILRGTAVVTLSVIVFGEAVERRLGRRLVSRFTDRELLALFRFLMAPETAPRPLTPTPKPEPTPRVSMARLQRIELVEA